MTILPRNFETVSVDFRSSIPKGFHGKIYPRSSLVKNIITVDADFIDSDYRGIVHILIVNHSNEAFTSRTGERVAQVVFVEHYNFLFKKVYKKEFSGITKRGEGGFGSSGVSEIKKSRTDTIILLLKSNKNVLMRVFCKYQILVKLVFCKYLKIQKIQIRANN